MDLEVMGVEVELELVVVVVLIEGTYLWAFHATAILSNLIQPSPSALVCSHILVHAD